MELTDNPKLVLELESYSGKLPIPDQTNGNGFQYTTKPESFVVDIDSLPNGSNGKEISQNSRITRNFNRKNSLRCGSGNFGGGGNKISDQNQAADTGGDPIPNSTSPIGGSSVGKLITPEKLAPPVAVVGLGSRDQLDGGGNGSSAQSHQISITTSSNNSGAESRHKLRKNSFKRSSSVQPCWYLDPRKVFIFCATLSCLGTMLLIYFAVSSSMLRVEETEQFDY